MAAHFESGFFVKDGAWHGLGTVVQNAPSIAEALKLAGLDWTVALIPAQAILPDGRHVIMDDTRAIVRETDGAYLGKTGNRYQPLQNDRAFAWFQPFVDANEATLETAGSLRGGRDVWILAKVAGESSADIVDGDRIMRHLLLSNPHDGEHALHVGSCNTRVVCANTLAVAKGEGGMIKIRHTKQTKLSLEVIRDLMRAEHKAFEKDVAAFRHLAKTPISAKKLREYVLAVFPDTFDKPENFKNARTIAGERWEPRHANRMPSEAAIVSAGLSIATPTIDSILGNAPALPSTIADVSDEFISPVYDRIVELVETGRGTEIPGVRGTYWGAYNSIQEHIQYEAGKGRVGFTDERAHSILLGGGATQNALALQKALEFARYGS